MFLAKTDIAARLLQSFSAGVTSLLLVYAGVIGDGSTLAHLLSIGLVLVHGGTVLRVLWRGRRHKPGQQIVYISAELTRLCLMLESA
jgi:hypothetical protein